MSSSNHWFVRDGKSETPIYDLLTNLYSPQKKTGHPVTMHPFFVLDVWSGLMDLWKKTNANNQQVLKKLRNHLKFVWGFHQVLQFFWPKGRNDTVIQQTIKLSTIYRYRARVSQVGVFKLTVIYWKLKLYFALTILRASNSWTLQQHNICWHLPPLAAPS